MVHPKLQQISNAGQMGKLISNFDWASTSLGDPELWSPILLTSLGIILESRIEMFIVWGNDRINFYNDAYIPLFGKRHPQVLGEKLPQVWTEIYDVIKPIFDEVYTGKSVHFENKPFRLIINDVSHDGFYTVTYLPIRLEDGTVGGVLGTSVDTTAEVLQKNALTESEKNFRNYQEMSPNPFFSLTPNWIVNYINPAALKEAGRKSEDIVGKLFWVAFVGARDTVFFKEYERAMKGETVEIEGHYAPFDTWYRVFAYPLSPGIGVITENVTESKRMQNQLKAAVEIRDRFLSIASHELKTPLTALKLNTQLMEKKLGTAITEENLKKFFEQADRQLSRLANLVGDMLDVSRIREGKLAFNFVTGDLKVLLAECVERFVPYYQNSDATPPSFSFEGQDFQCRVDLSRFEQVMSNLLMNALKYGEGKDVHVKVCDKIDKLVITVEDHGMGIPESDQHLIFEQFYRAKNVHEEGLGLGLFITRQIVEAHGGNISLKSTLGKGTTFQVELPKR